MNNPMLAATAKTADDIKFPVIASPKLDGIRARIIEGMVMSRSNKPIPNLWVQTLFGKEKYNGLDGELILGDPTAPDVYRKTDSAVMTIEGTPNITFYVFDDFTNPEERFIDRYRSSVERITRLPKSVVSVPHVTIKTIDELDKSEASWLQSGYEGAMLRDPNGSYKSGRSTVKQGGLLKLKRFEDSEARILDFEEEKQNTNEATVNETGAKQRSLKKAGMVGKNTLGALVVEDLKTGVKFKIGSGFTKMDREKMWLNRAQLRGLIVKYRFFAGGIKDKPRFPVYHGFRNLIDL